MVSLYFACVDSSLRFPLFFFFFFFSSYGSASVGARYFIPNGKKNGDHEEGEVKAGQVLLGENQ